MTEDEYHGDEWYGQVHINMTSNGREADPAP